MEKEDENVENIKFILAYYEGMSGMKINYEKSEVYVGSSDLEQERIADLFHCKIGKFPIIYLGLPISDSKLSKSQLILLVIKHLGGWVPGSVTTYLKGVKSILIGSCLSSIPLYTIGVHVLYEGNYQLLDCLRFRFFWQGTNKKTKYHMVKWEALNRPKDFGDLGFIDIRVMNSCLVCKWIDRLERGNSSVCCDC